MPYWKSWQRLQAYRGVLFLWVVIILLGVIGFGLEFIQAFSTPTMFTKPEAVAPELPEQLRASASAELMLPPKLTSNSVWVYDRQTDSVVWQWQADVATAPASLVKMMTALVAHERLDWEEPVPVGQANQVEGNRAKFLASDIFLTKDLMRAMLLFSANDAAYALATHQLPLDEFILLMNEKAVELGLQNSHFTNVTGLDSPEQVTSAEDLGKITNALLDIPTLADIVNERSATITEQVTKRQDIVYTTNSMLHQGTQYKGVKTGTTDLAGQNLVVRLVDTWNVDGQETPIDLVVILLGSEDRYKDARFLIEWLSTNVHWLQSPV